MRLHAALVIGATVCACRSQPAPASASSSTPPPAPASEPVAVPRLGGTMPTPYLDWPALAEALEGRAEDEAAARRNLCHEGCSGEPPWLIAAKDDGTHLEYRLVAPIGEALLVTPIIVSLYDNVCQATVESKFDRSGPVPTLSLHIGEEHIVPDRNCPPDDEVCDDICATVEWDCRVRYVPQTLEIAIEDCVRGEPPQIIP